MLLYNCPIVWGVAPICSKAFSFPLASVARRLMFSSDIPLEQICTPTCVTIFSWFKVALLRLQGVAAGLDPPLLLAFENIRIALFVELT